MNVIKRFRDKFTKKVYKKGDPYAREDEKRVAFLIKEGYLQAPKEKKKTPTKKKGD